MFTLVVIDPYPISRIGLAQLLTEAFPQSTIIAADMATTTAKQDPINCDLLLIGLNLQEFHCQQFNQLLQRYQPKNILLLIDSNLTLLPSFYQQQPLIRGIITKNASPLLIQASVQLVLAGGNCFPNHNDAKLNIDPQPNNHWLNSTTEEKPVIDSSQEASLLGLTLRQYEVLVLLAQGYPIKSIAKDLKISIATAKSHTETLYQRLKVNNRNAAVYTAITRGATLGWTQQHH